MMTYNDNMLSMQCGFTITEDGVTIWDSSYASTTGGTDYQTVGTIIQNLITAYNSGESTFTLSTQDFT